MNSKCWKVQNSIKDTVVEYVYFSGSCQCAGSCVYFTLQVLECSTPSNVQHFLELLIANKQNQNKQNTFLHIFPSSVSVWAPPFII